MEEVNVSLLERRRRCGFYLPLTKGAQAAFLVKASDGLLSGILTINMFAASYVLSWGDISAPWFLNNPAWKCITLGVPFAWFPVTVWISSMAKAAEQDLTGLTTVSWFVFLELGWVLTLGGFMTCLMSNSTPWIVGVVTVALFLLILFIWLVVFKQAECLRPCCCCWRDVETANAEDQDQEIIISVFRARARRAQKLCAAHLRAKSTAADAREAANKFKVETATAKGRVEQAEHVVQAAIKAAEDASSKEASAADVKDTSQRNSNWYKDREEEARKEAVALLERKVDSKVAERIVDKASTEAHEASMEAENAKNAHEKAKKDLEEAEGKVTLARQALSLATADFNEAKEREQGPNANAEKKEEEAAVLKGEAELAASEASSIKQIVDSW